MAATSSGFRWSWFNAGGDVRCGFGEPGGRSRLCCCRESDSVSCHVVLTSDVPGGDEGVSSACLARLWFEGEREGTSVGAIST